MHTYCTVLAVSILQEQKPLQTESGTNCALWSLIKYTSVRVLFLSGSWTEPAGEKGLTAILSLVPGGLSDPVEREARVRSDLDRSCLCLSDRLLNRLHQVLSIVHQHLSSLLREANEQ